MLLIKCQEVKSSTGQRRVVASETFANREVGARACREVLVACFRSHYPAQAPHQKKLHQTPSVNVLGLFKLIQVKTWTAKKLREGLGWGGGVVGGRFYWHLLAGCKKINAPPQTSHHLSVTSQILLGALTQIRYASSMREATDEQLMQRYAKGEAKAFDELYTRHRGPLYRYFIRQVNNPATANDLYQGAWEKIIQGRQKYRPTAPFTAWMYSLAHNHLVDYYRRLRPGDPLETDDLSDNQPGPVQGVIEGEQNDQLRSGINALPEEQKNTLLLKLETGLKMEDIARVTGVSRETVKSRLRYAVNKLKRSLVE
jgi:RNA polymerase sigma factor (sigma-70 family)